MSKYTIRIEGGDLPDADRTIECKGYAILADYNGTSGTTRLQGINLLTLSAIIAGSEEIRDAAKLTETIMKFGSGKQLSIAIEEIGAEEAH